MRGRGDAALVAVWAGLVVATAASIGLHSLAAGAVALVSVLVVTFAKVAIVGRHFMELRGAPRALRLLFGAYVVIVPLCLALIYAAG